MITRKVSVRMSCGVMRGPNHRTQKEEDDKVDTTGKTTLHIDYTQPVKHRWSYWGFGRDMKTVIKYDDREGYKNQEKLKTWRNRMKNNHCNWDHGGNSDFKINCQFRLLYLCTVDQVCSRWVIRSHMHSKHGQQKTNSEWFFFSTTKKFVVCMNVF